jgi:hypothetical protein
LHRREPRGQQPRGQGAVVDGLLGVFRQRRGALQGAEDAAHEAVVLGVDGGALRGEVGQLALKLGDGRRLDEGDDGRVGGLHGGREGREHGLGGGKLTHPPWAQKRQGPVIADQPLFSCLWS